jgi:hypothetical protein
MTNPDLKELRRLADGAETALTAFIKAPPDLRWETSIAYGKTVEQLGLMHPVILRLLDRLEAAELRGYKRGIEDAAKWHDVCATASAELMAKIERAINDEQEHNFGDLFDGDAETWTESRNHRDNHRRYAAAIRKLEP